MQDTSIEEITASGELTDSEALEMPTKEWSAAALAHASVLLTVVLGTPGGVGVPIGLAVPLVMYLGYRRQSRYVAFHALQAFAYQVVGTLIIAILGMLVAAAWTISSSLAAVLIGLVLMPFALSLTLLLIGAAVAWVVYGLYAAYQVYQGRDFRYWLIGECLEREVRL
jgi:uncharacterized Tic20 family protein